MSRNVDRRDFLRSSCQIGLAASVANVVRPAAAIEPVQHGNSPFFKFSLAAYSYRDLLNAKNPDKKLTLDDFIDDCAKMGLEGTELTSYYFPPEPTPDFLRGLKHRAFLRGLDISGTAVGNDFCYPKGEKRDAEIKDVKRWIDYAEIMGAPVIRIFSGHPHGTSESEAQSLAVAAMEECCQYAGEHGVMLALENHGGLTTTADGMLALVRDVKSPWFGVNLDTGNFNSEDPYADLAKIAPYAVNVQVKVSITPAGGKRQPADFSRLAEIVKSAGYRGYVALEFEEGGNPREECPRYVDKMREAFKA